MRIEVRAGLQAVPSGTTGLEGLAWGHFGTRAMTGPPPFGLDRN